MDYSKLVTENRNEASKVYKNLMVDMVPTNKKLEARAALERNDGFVGRAIDDIRREEL